MATISSAVTSDVAYALTESGGHWVMTMVLVVHRSTASCSGFTNGGSLTGQSVTLQPGEDVTCEITNDDIVP